MFADLPVFLINRLLTAEPWAADLLRPHIGQTALLELAGAQLRFTVDESLRLQSSVADACNAVIIRVPPEALASLLDGPENLSQYAHIEGNAAFAETIAKLLKHLRPDLAAWLAPHLGDVLATRITQGVSTLHNTALKGAQKAGIAALSLVRDEAQLVVSTVEHEAFQRTLERVSTDLDALTQRLENLARTH
jgi:ubiquinone biosynthesis protein UbiJ